MASGSALGVDIISDSSFSSSETDSDSDGNVRFSEFDSDSRQRSGSDDNNAFLGFCEPADTPVFTWDKSYGPRPNPIPDFDDSNTRPTNSLNAEATTLDFFSLFMMLLSLNRGGATSRKRTQLTCLPDLA